MFGGNATDDLLQGALRTDLTGNVNPRDVQFYSPFTSDADGIWEDIGLHEALVGCETAALNGLDCSQCGCNCGELPVAVDCVQTFNGCSNCSATECGQIGYSECTYTTINEGSGLGILCEKNYTQVCPIVPCPDPTTSGTPTTFITVVDCAAPYSDTNNPLDQIIDGKDLGGSCNSAGMILTCEELTDIGADCMTNCNCYCGSSNCNSRPFFEESKWSDEDGKCLAATYCDDPCTKHIKRPDIESLNFTCEELLSTRLMTEVDDLFAASGLQNYCRDYKCCENYGTGGGIPDDQFGSPVYECYSTTTTTTTTMTPNEVTADPCNVFASTVSGQTWTVSDLIDRELSCFQIANVLGGYLDNSQSVELESLTYYEHFPQNYTVYRVAKECGCQDTCEVDCSGCDNLNDALVTAGVDTSSYFCSDIRKDFNMDCSSCGCPNPDECDSPVLSASNSSKQNNLALDDLSCNDLSEVLTCEEIANYTAIHGKANICENCQCSTPEPLDSCDVPCGGGIYGQNSSSGYQGIDPLLSCNDFIAADLTCQQASDAGCTGCEECGCEEPAPVTSQTCQTMCNDLSMTCEQLVEYFTCDDLTHSVFDGCNCGACECVEAFSESTCNSACMEGQTCDYWVDTEMSGRYFYTCDNLESDYGCDCSGCDCEAHPTMPIVTNTNCSTGSTCIDLNCEIVSDMSGYSYEDLESMYGCDCAACMTCKDDGCEGYSCEDWLNTFDNQGAYLECTALENELDCDCSGCDCRTSTTVSSTTSPTTTVVDNSCQPCSKLSEIFDMELNCDEFRTYENTLSCAYMETFFECDCRGCACEDVPEDVCM
jgi:hypothetical protein